MLHRLDIDYYVKAQEFYFRTEQNYYIQNIAMYDQSDYLYLKSRFIGIVLLRKKTKKIVNKPPICCTHQQSIISIINTYCSP